MARKILNIGMRPEYANKQYCRTLAKDILTNGQIAGMTVRQLAAEIFTHGYIHNRYPKLPAWIRNMALTKRIYASCDNGVDLADDGDTRVRKFGYAMIFLIFPSVKI
jgi:hypothetical protein